MNRITAKDRQTLLDVQLIACGTLEGVIDACALNGMSLTDDLVDGQVLDMCEATKTRTVAMYQNKSYDPATAIVISGGKKYGGIGYMAVGIDFIVS